MIAFRSNLTCGLCGVGVLLLTIWAGCDAPPKSADGSRGRSPSSKALSGDAVPPPPGVDAATLARRTGDDLVKARMTLDQIAAALPTPSYLTPPESAATLPADGELAVAAQRAYVEGRLAWREGRNFDAVQALQRAQRVAPNSPEILRLLGKIYATSGNRVRGAQLLEQAISMDPTDIESLVHLAMYAQDQGRFNDAIATFIRAMDLGKDAKNLDPAIKPLAHFYLGNALEREGYDAAAIQQYEAYLALPRHFSRSTAMVRELAFLYRQRAATHQTVGDLHNRLDQTEQALQAYQRTMGYEPDDAVGVMARAMYTHLRRGEVEAARDACLQVVRRAPAEPRTASLLKYLIDAGAGGPSFAQALEDIYLANDRPPTLALTLVEILPPDRARALMQAHLAAKPSDTQVYRKLLGDLWSGQPDDSAGAVAAVRTTSAAIDLNPGGAEPLAQTLFDIASSPSLVTQAVDSLSEDERNTAAVRYLRAASLLRDRRFDEAAVDLRAAMDADDRLVDARVHLAGLLIQQGKLDEATALLDVLGDSRDSDVIGLRVKLLTEAGRTAEALSLLDRQIEADPTNLDLVMDKAGLQLRAGDAVAAERTLQDALNMQPSSERLYEALFELYDSAAAPPDAVQQYQRLMRRMLSTLPNSRVARLQRAKLHDARGEFREAEQLLRGLIEEQPDDLKALDALLDVMVRSDRRGEADQLIEERLTRSDDDRDVLRIAHRHYSRTGNTDKINNILERLLLKEPDSPAKYRSLAIVYLNSDRPNEALDMMFRVLAGPVEDPTGFVSLIGRAAAKANRVDEADPKIRELIDRFPDHEADLLFEYAMVFERRGEREKAEQMMLDLLVRHPDHAPTNNGLGYAWANEGRDLDKAQAMIQAAVDADANAAYLDSMGWVLYKKGQFEDAVTWLRRSKAAPGGDYPVILDHLGDALYRLGRRREAINEWRLAQQLLANLTEGVDDDPELIGMADRLKAKLDAAQKNQPAPVAAVPGLAGDAAAPRLDEPEPRPPAVEVRQAEDN